jgi:peptidoglycan/LPS O-acetylase OafA/YrhL
MSGMLKRDLPRLIFRKEGGALRTDIQALRALAVIAVVIYHIWPTRLTGGFMGVDVFFVISGYLMTLTIQKGVRYVCEGRQKLRASAKFFLSFYARRIRRLAPAGSICLISVILATYLIGDFSLQTATAPQVFASAVFMQNWFLANQSVDYLGADAGATAVQHFWSLSIEEQFYLIWPLLLLVAGLLMIRIANRNKPVKLLVVVGLITAVGFIYGYHLTITNAAKAYFVTPARIWELSFGGIAVFLPSFEKKIGEYIRFLLPWIGLTMIGLPMILWDGSNFPGWHALLPTSGTLLVIWGGVVTADQNHRVFSLLSVTNLSRFRPAGYFGDISYSLYLWHWPIIVLIPFYLGVDFSQNKMLKIYIFIASLAVATVSYFLIENPTRNFMIKSPRPIKASLITCLCGAILLCMILVPANLQAIRAANFTDDIVTKAFNRAQAPDDFAFGTRAVLHQDELDYDPWGRVDREWSQFGSSHFSGSAVSPDSSYGFDTSINSKVPVDFIGVFGDEKATKTILVLGDSYSQQWYPAIDVAARNLGYKVVAANSITAGGGMFALETIDGEDTFAINKEQGAIYSVKRACDMFNFIKEHLWAKADVVIVGVSPVYFTLSGDSPQTSEDANVKLAQTFKDITAVTGCRPLLIQGIPVIGGSGDQTVFINRIDKEIVDYDEYMNRVYNSLKDIGETSVCEYIRIEHLFQDKNGVAHTQIGGVPVYFNTNHVSTLYSASVGEYFTNKLQLG